MPRAPGRGRLSGSEGERAVASIEKKIDDTVDLAISRLKSCVQEEIMELKGKMFGLRLQYNLLKAENDALRLLQGNGGNDIAAGVPVAAVPVPVPVPGNGDQEPADGGNPELMDL
ncbi:uncharacterized protein LOC135197319 [Macrobrachium nipponense]|uniref:uncharacterized protein LOC135197319 n=1 Tax=Macrobrachium nipponense TaxID=159736 RepID=UPI0030C8454D